MCRIRRCRSVGAVVLSCGFRWNVREYAADVLVETALETVR